MSVHPDGRGPEVPDRPRRARSVVVEHGPETAGHDVVAAQDSGRYFRVGRPQGRILRELDGSRTLTEIADDSGVDPTRLSALVARFVELGLVEPDADLEPTFRPPGPARRIRSTEAGRIEIRLLDPDAALRRLTPRVRPFVRPAALPFAGLLAGLAILAVGIVVTRDHPDIRLALSPVGVVSLVLAMLATIALHELGHALAVVLGGGRVRRMGVLIFYLMPGMFCDTSDSWRFRARADRVAVAAAGLLTQLALVVLVLQLLWLPLPENAQSLLLVYASTNVGLVVYNLVPFVKLDGYWMLVGALDRPGLRERAITRAAAWWRWPAMGAPRPSARPRAVLLAAFGLSCAIAAPTLLLVALWRYGGYLIGLGTIPAILWLLAVAFLLGRSLLAVARATRRVERPRQTRAVAVTGLLTVVLLGVPYLADRPGADAIVTHVYQDRLSPAWNAARP